MKKILFLISLIVTITLVIFIVNLNDMAKEGRALDIELNESFSQIYKQKKWVLNRDKCDKIIKENGYNKTDITTILNYFVYSIDTTINFKDNMCYLIEVSVKDKYDMLSKDEKKTLDKVMTKYQVFSEKYSKRVK